MRRCDFAIGLLLASATGGAGPGAGQAAPDCDHHPRGPEGFADLAREVAYRKPGVIVAITNPSRERSTRRPAQYRSFGPLYRFLYRFSADAEAIRWPTKPHPSLSARRKAAGKV